MRPRHLILPLLFLLLVGFANAQLDIQVTPVKDTIEWNGTAIYNVLVSGIADPIRLRPATFEWGTVRFENPIVTSGSPTRVEVQPPRNVLIGNYAVEILALSNLDADVRISDFLKLTVTSELPHIEPDWGIPADLEPGATDVNLILKNTGTATVEDVTVKMESGLLDSPINLDVGGMIKGEAREVWEDTLDLPLNTPAKQYEFVLTIYDKGEYLYDLVHKVNVLEKEAVDINVFKDPKFLGTEYTVTIENVGNTLASDYYTIDVPKWQRFFIEGKVKPILTINPDGTAKAAWPYSLPIGASSTLVYSISFLPILAILIAALLLLYVGYWYMMQGLSIAKELHTGEKSLKVKLHVKNNSTKPQRNVIVEDTVPTPLTLVREFATVQPTAIRKVDGAVKMQWKFDVIWPHEEKILNYGVKTALSVVGMVMLPAARIKKKGDPGEAPKVFLSNRVAVKGKIKAGD